MDGGATNRGLLTRRAAAHRVFESVGGRKARLRGTEAKTRGIWSATKRDDQRDVRRPRRSSQTWVTSQDAYTSVGLACISDSTDASDSASA